MPKKGSEVALITGSGAEGLFPLEPLGSHHTEHGEATVYRSSARGRGFYVLPRHGVGHTIPPHKINHRANISALYDLGVGRMITVSAVGSMNRRFRVGEVGLLGQFIDFSGQRVTFYEDESVHTDMTEPFDPAIRGVLLDAAARLGTKLHPGLVYVSVEGPRYETAAEVRMFRGLGGDVVGMTTAQEAILARELGIPLASLVVATNWAAGIQRSVSHEEVLATMKRSEKKLSDLLSYAIPSL